MRLAVECYGTGEPVLVLLHGVGANGAVWLPLIEHLRGWPGRILVPDLRGHGRSPRAAAYGLGQHAADVAALLAPDDGRVYVAGHSMGGAIALVLAGGWFGRSIAGTLALSMKAAFDTAELEKARTFARAPARRFASRDEAIARYLRVSGLDGLVTAGSPIASAGIAERDGEWSLAADPATVLAAGPAIAPMLAAARGALIVATGERDPIAPPAGVRGYAPQARVVPGAAHNVHVEAPAVIATLIAEVAA